MKETYPIAVTVKEIIGKGTPACGFKPGDSWEVAGNETINDFCGWAFTAIFPFITVLRFGGKFPWEEDPDTATVCCPDPHNPVVFEIKRKDSRGQES